MKVSKKVPALIVDIDGTIADNTHRKHYIEGGKKDWDGFFSQLHLDTPRESVATAVRFFWIHKLWTPIFVTGRSADYREQTREWLAQHFMWSVNMPLFTRAKGDFRPDTEIKREIYERDLAPHHDVRLVLDDRDSVVKMWRSLGLECWQVAEGAF